MDPDSSQNKISLKGTHLHIGGDLGECETGWRDCVQVHVTKRNSGIFFWLVCRGCHKPDDFYWHSKDRFLGERGTRAVGISTNLLKSFTQDNKELNGWKVYTFDDRRSDFVRVVSFSGSHFWIYLTSSNHIISMCTQIKFDYFSETYRYKSKLVLESCVLVFQSGINRITRTLSR